MTGADEVRSRRWRWGGLVAAFMMMLATLIGPGPAARADAQGDAVRGGRLFLQCRACHSVGQNDPSGVGPNLWGMVGAKAGTKPGYHYSSALLGSGVVWTPTMLDRWLTQPTAVAPGTTMAFQGVASPDSRRDIIAYLATLGGPAGGKGER